MPTIITRGASSAQALGFASSLDVTYVEDVFSTQLYVGTGAVQTITNDINLSEKGGLVWIKSRNAAFESSFFDTVRGPLDRLTTSNAGSTSIAGSGANTLTAFNGNGFTLGTSSSTNSNTTNYVSWTFRKQQKFFDIVRYTGTGANTTVAHSLGSIPGMIMIRRVNSTGGGCPVGDWQVYHRSLANTQYTVPNTTAAVATGATRWNSTTPTASVFSVGTDTSVNASGGAYIAYIFAHNAGGFGVQRVDSIVSCGLFSTDAAAAGSATLGYEPQFVMIKNITAAEDWYVLDTTRGLSSDFNNQGDAGLSPNLAAAEANRSFLNPTATGFDLIGGNWLSASSDYIYLAIRRGPMKIPTDATKVFGITARTGTGAIATVTSTPLNDMVLIKNRSNTAAPFVINRLTNLGYMTTNADTAETQAAATILQSNTWDLMNGVKLGTTSSLVNTSANTYINYHFRRAPGFFDVTSCSFPAVNVADYRVPHNLGVVPEMIVGKQRDGIAGWYVYHVASGVNYYIFYGSTAARVLFTALWGTAPTATTFGTAMTPLGQANTTWLYHLFATLPGISKVGSYTGNGSATARNIECGFTTGARFVLIKNNAAAGGWYVWDSTRGIGPTADPYFFLNSTAVEAAGFNYLNSYSGGFQINTTLGGINATGQEYIFLAIA